MYTVYTSLLLDTGAKTMNKTLKINLRHYRKIINVFTDYVFILPAFLFILIFSLYPMVYNIKLSFLKLTIKNFMTGGTWTGFANYVSILHDINFVNATKVSLIFTISCIILEFIFGFAMALLFVQKFPGAGFMRGSILIVYMLPPVVVGTVFKWILAGDSGVVNFFLRGLHLISQNVNWLTDTKVAILSVIMANTWHGTPFYMLFLLGALLTLPGEIYEAARIDGAGHWKSFFSITLPILKPAILILIMLGFIFSFKVFDLVYVMTNGGPVNATAVLPYYAFKLSFMEFNFGQGGAASVVLVAILAIIAIFYLREVRKEESN
jgi:multiple sugar transport system permease protein